MKALCKVLGVSRSAYYGYLSSEAGGPSAGDAALAKELGQLFAQHKRRYGSRRLQSALRDKGHGVGRHRVRGLMRALSLKAIQPRSFVPRTTQPDSSKARSPNLLLEMGLPGGPNQVVVGDITYLPCEDGWLYLAAWMDLYSRYIGAWHLDDHMEASLVVAAFNKMLERRRPPAGSGLVVHSDGGSQYSSTALRGLLAVKGLRQSMTRRDNHYDNAFMESLFSRLKAELLEDCTVFKSKEEARLKVFEYIDGYYNTHRKHSSLGYLSPAEFERKKGP